MNGLFNYVEFIKGVPMLFVKHERYVVVGDLHIGTEFKMREKGIYVAGNAAEMARRINSACYAMHSNGVVFLGDVKESVSYPLDEEKSEIVKFFSALDQKNIIIAKGNHDAYLEEILGADRAKIQKEILLHDVALMHGNAMPSGEAIEKKVLVLAHGHMSIEINGAKEKVWIVARGKRKGNYAVLVSAFNDLVTGGTIARGSEKYLPIMKSGVYDFESAMLYSLQGKRLGTVGEYIEEKEREKALTA